MFQIGKGAISVTARIALFRALNVGTANRISVKDLGSLFEEKGLGPARSLQAAGSFVFSGGGKDGEVEAILEAGVLTEFGVQTTAFVRSRAAWLAGLEGNPFAEAAETTPDRLMLLTLKSAPAASACGALAAAARDGELCHVGGSFAYLYYPLGAGKSRLSPQIIDRCLGAPSTARNWNSAQKLAAMAKDG